MPFVIDGTTGFNLPSGADLTVNGNFTVSGTTTTISTETLTVDDNIIVLNNNEAGTPSENAGIEVERGTSTNVSIRWNETTDKWQFTNDGTTYTDIGAGGDVVDDTTPQLGGNLDVNNKNITGTGDIEITGHLSVGGVHQLASYLSGGTNGDIFRVGSNSSVNMKVNVGGSGVRIMASSGRELRLLSDGDTTEKGIVIASDGNVGVGTESPATQLHIDEGTSNSYATIRLEGNNRGGDIEMYQGTLPVSTIRTDQSGNMFFKTSGAFGNSSVDNRLTILTAGNVGIGTDNPTTNYGKVLQIHDTGTSGANLRLTDSTSGAGTGNGLDIIQLGVDSYFINREAGDVNFYTNGQERFTIHADGHLGFGDSVMNDSPWSTVFGARSQWDTMGTIAATDGSMQIGHNWYYDAGGSTGYKYIAGGKANRQIHVNDYISWELTNSTGIAGGEITFVEQMRLTGDGKLGIGTNSPGTRLQVAGTQNTPSSTSKGMLLVRADGSTHGLQMGVMGTSPWGSWIQAQDNDIATAYPLSLQPGGGIVHVPDTARLIVGNTLSDATSLSSVFKNSLQQYTIMGSTKTAISHPGSASSTKHYLYDRATVSDKINLPLEVAFPNGVSNLAIRLYYNDYSLWVSGEAIIGSTYANAQATGFRRYSFSHNYNGAGNYENILNNTENVGLNSSHMEFNHHGWDANESGGAHYFEFRHIQSSGNTLYLQFQLHGSGKYVQTGTWYFKCTTY